MFFGSISHEPERSLYSHSFKSNSTPTLARLWKLSRTLYILTPPSYQTDKPRLTSNGAPVWMAFLQMGNNLLQRNPINLKSILRTFIAILQPVFLDGHQIWRLRTVYTRPPDAFNHWCFRPSVKNKPVWQNRQRSDWKSPADRLPFSIRATPPTIVVWTSSLKPDQGLTAIVLAPSPCTDWHRRQWDN